MVNFKSINEFVGNVTKGTFGIILTSNTTPKMRKTANPYFGRVTKVTTLTNVALGWGYESVVKARMTADPTTWKEEPPKGKMWVVYPYILASIKEPTKQYLRTYMRKNTNASVTYLVDGRVATDEEVAEIKTFLPTPPHSNKQEAFGISQEDEVVVRDYTISGIQLLKQGDKVYEA